MWGKRILIILLLSSGLSFSPSVGICSSPPTVMVYETELTALLEITKEQKMLLLEVQNLLEQSESNLGNTELRLKEVSLKLEQRERELETLSLLLNEAKLSMQRQNESLLLLSDEIKEKEKQNKINNVKNILLSVVGGYVLGKVS